MPKRMRKSSTHSTDPIKLEYNHLHNSIINDPQSVCFGCGRSLNDSQFVLDVKNLPNHKHKNHLYLHNNCLRCFECKEQLEETGKCFFNRGKIWCESHYFGQRMCSGCKKSIESGQWFRTAGFKNYHITCFNCNRCNKQLISGDQFKYGFQDQEFQLVCSMHFDVNKECTDGNESDSNASVSSSQTKGCSKTKRVRTTFTKDQLQILHTHFQIDSNPDGQDLERIATRTGLSKRVTQVWFQNSRARQKKFRNKSGSTPPPLTNLNSASLNSINGTANNLVISCTPDSINGTPNSSSSSNGGTSNPLSSLQCATNISPSNDTSSTQQLPVQQANLSHSTNTNYSNQMNSPYQDHSELNSPLLMMNNSFKNDLITNHLECLNGSLNSLGSNSSSLNSNSGTSSGISCNLTFNSTNNLKKLTATGNSLTSTLSNGHNFTANRENVNSINSLEWNLELPMKAGTNNCDNRDVDNLSNLSIQNSSSNFTTIQQHTWLLGNLLDANLCNTNALLAGTNDGSLFDYSNQQLNKYFISGN